MTRGPLLDFTTGTVRYLSEQEWAEFAREIGKQHAGVSGIHNPDTCPGCRYEGDARAAWNLLVNQTGIPDTDSNWVSFRQWFDRAARGAA